MSELKAEELEHIAYMQTIEIQSLNARIAELKVVIEILEDQQREVKNILIDKNLHIDSLYEEGYKLQQRIAELEGEIAKMKKYFHKPAHGACCTCQKCGHTYDECRCDFDEAFDDLDKANARIAELEAENAGLKAYIDQLIEIGGWAITGMTIATSYSPGEMQNLAEKKSDDWYALIKNLKECDKEKEREE